MTTDIALRTTFNNEAERYHVYRPYYPDTLFDTLVTTTQLKANARLLEIGPGTGRATESMAQRGYTIIGVELGAELAQIAQKTLAKYPHVQILTAAFEEVDLSPGTFDLIYAATAFHWIKPEYQFSKPHQLLAPGGHLAIISTHHVSDEAGDRFFFASQPIYKKHYPDNPLADDFRPPRQAELKAEKADDHLFTPVAFHVFPLVVRYSAQEYVQLLQTYSPTIAMEAHSRTAFLADMAQLIEEAFDGSILKHYAITLTITRKTADA